MFLGAVDDVVEDADEVGAGDVLRQSVHLELVESRKRRTDEEAEGGSQAPHQGEVVALLLPFVRQQLRRDAGGA